jgi:TonB family protein
MYFRLLTLSLLIHLLLYMGLKSVSDPIYQVLDPDEIQWTLKPPQDSKQIVIFAEAPEIEVVDTKATDLLSKKWQRVREETQAAKSGRTENRNPLPQAQLQPKPKQEKESLSDRAKPKEVDFSALSGLFAKSGESSSGERIFKNIPIGDFNALNTDAYTFYSFHERIEERVRVRWVQGIERSLLDLKNRGQLHQLAKGESSTIMEVALDKKGYYQNSKIFQSSGNRAWDEAAVMAFQNGAPFLNPPIEIVKEDGTIRLRYRFSVFWDPKYIPMIR